MSIQIPASTASAFKVLYNHQKTWYRWVMNLTPTNVVGFSSNQSPSCNQRVTATGHSLCLQLGEVETIGFAHGVPPVKFIPHEASCGCATGTVGQGEEGLVMASAWCK